MTEIIDKLSSDYQEELTSLKERADLLGIKYSNNIGLDTLRDKVNAKLEEGAVAKEAITSMASIRKKEMDEQLKLVRIRLTMMNPMKKAWRGEMITVANNLIGVVKKFVPYDSRFYTNGYHVPQCIYNVLKERTFLNIETRQEKGRIQVTHSYIPECAIEVLPQLTKEELMELAAAQAAGNRIDPA